MTTSQQTVDYILEQTADAGKVTAKKMFGGYCVYCDGKVVALVCDDELFVKITPAGNKYLGKCPEKPPYPGAKPYFFISGDQWEDGEWLSQLIKITADELPVPKKKTVKNKN